MPCIYILNTLFVHVSLTFGTLIVLQFVHHIYIYIDIVSPKSILNLKGILHFFFGNRLILQLPQS